VRIPLSAVPLADGFTTLISRGGFDHAIFILHTHSDDTTGDLVYTSRDDVTKTPLSQEVGPVSPRLTAPIPALMSLGQFFDSVVGADMRSYLKGMEFSSLFLLSCGAVVRVKEARDGLKMVAEWQGASLCSMPSWLTLLLVFGSQIPLHLGPQGSLATLSQSG
jgi:hypothetical protein